MHDDVRQAQARRRERERQRDRDIEAAHDARHGGFERWLAAGATPAARRSGERYHVEFGPRYRIVVAVLWLLTAALTAFAILALDDRPENGIEAALMLISMAAVPAIRMQAACIHFALAFDAEGLHVRNRWGRWKMFPWHRVHSVRLSRKGDAYTILMRDHPPIEVSWLMSGHQSLVDEIRRRTRHADGATQ